MKEQVYSLLTSIPDDVCITRDERSVTRGVLLTITEVCDIESNSIGVLLTVTEEDCDMEDDG